MRNQERTNVALDKLNKEVAAILDSETWKAALRLRSRLHKYSFNNLLLVWLQRPDATMLAGYRKWEEFDRHVRKGEKGIAILAPILVTERDPDTNEPTGNKKLVGYRTVYVFDVAQTDGAELPALPRPPILTGDDEGCVTITARLMELAEANGTPVAMQPLDRLGGAKGYYQPATKRIVIGDGQTAKETTAVLIHELGHALLQHGGPDYDYDLGELEAETTSYLVMDALGLPTNESAFTYLAHYTRDPENLPRLLQAGARASKVADKILEALKVDEEGQTAPPPTTTAQERQQVTA